jgi:hypothetical protein
MDEVSADLAKNVKHSGNNPAKDIDLNTLGLAVAAKWKLNPQITLLWVTQAQHEANVTQFSSTLAERQTTGGGRKEKTDKLDAYDIVIDDAISALKGYLVYKYEKKNAPSYYPQFGIVRQGKNFIVPRDRDRRQAALKLIVPAITEHGFDDEKYGAAFWQETSNSYTALLQQAAGVDGTVSLKVSAKNQLRKDLVKTHNALINILRGNYPDTYKAVLREWGFQKEKY